MWKTMQPSSTLLSGTYVLVILTENGSIRNVRNLSSIIYSAMEQATG